MTIVPFLALSTLFHQKAEQYKENVPKWNTSCEISNVSTDITTLETSIHQHQSLYETMCQAYTEVHSTSKKLLYQLDHLVQLCKQPSEDRRHVRVFYLLNMDSLQGFKKRLKSKHKNDPNFFVMSVSKIQNDFFVYEIRSSHSRDTYYIKTGLFIIKAKYRFNM